MKTSLDAKRREFIALCVIAGMSSVIPARLLSEEIKKTSLVPKAYSGLLLEVIINLLAKLDRREVTEDYVVDEIKKRFDEIDLPRELEEFVGSTKKDKQAFNNIYKSEDAQRALNLSLYWVPAHESVPPHGHHSLLSNQVVLTGSLQCRQYERIKKVDDSHLTLTLNREIIVNKGDCIKMNENRDNIHWFGSGKEATLIFNVNSTYKPIHVFDPLSKIIGRREFIDPTLGNIKGGFILARIISSEEAREKFGKRSVFG